MYQIVNVDEQEPTQPEQLGSKRKFWFTGADGTPVLFKEGRPNTGENWAEKVACELSSLLDLPHAHYELAIWRGTKGVVTRSFVPPGGRLVFGNELLARFVRGYAADRVYRQTQHTVRAVIAVLRANTIMLPQGYGSNPIAQAADLFVGYLLLDAWIGNTDRHHENWGLLVTPPRRIELAPTFDHASSLGREETDERRMERLATRDKRRSVDAYAARARSAFFRNSADKRPLSTLDAFLLAARFQRRAGTFWLDRLGSVEWPRIDAIFGEMPQSEMSKVSQSFARKLLEINQQKLLALRSAL
jgi:hypothetical protein